MGPLKLLPCTVCRLLDEDTTPKPVYYCTRCQAYLCETCYHSATRRARAMIRMKIEEWKSR